MTKVKFKGFKFPERKPTTVSDISELHGLVPSQASAAGREAVLTSNALLSSGSIIAPAVVVATSFQSALALCIVFSIVTFLTVLICSFVPRKLVYTVRIIVYTFVASLVYIPVAILMENIMPAQFTALGIYAPLLITNSFITMKTESKFFRLKRGFMAELCGFYILGYDLALLFFGFMRELLTNGGLFGVQFLPLSIPSVGTVYGGFILLALTAATFRWILGRSQVKS
ncbi:MAG: electron transport complex subunit E [Oscillospiraceae bacterium]|nr:electron transport complex subunit E [Oscillospiraceae bacterium]